jgi:hypothetical protein
MRETVVDACELAEATIGNQQKGWRQPSLDAVADVRSTSGSATWEWMGGAGHGPDRHGGARGVQAEADLAGPTASPTQGVA